MSEDKQVKLGFGWKRGTSLGNKTKKEGIGLFFCKQDQGKNMEMLPGTARRKFVQPNLNWSWSCIEMWGTIKRVFQNSLITKGCVEITLSCYWIRMVTSWTETEMKQRFLMHSLPLQHCWQTKRVSVPWAGGQWLAMINSQVTLSLWVYNSMEPDEINPRIFKGLVDVIAKPLSMIFEKSWVSG